MKIFAFFLPQFHEIPENNEWWGQGFTEWVNIRAAKPLYPRHQLIHPKNQNYYCLLDKETVQWQTDLLQQYHLDGMIYYHYYFRGKMLLEKPAQNLLGWKDIQQKFFFCWANHPWKRSWEGKQDILMPMEYGNQQDWEEHFQYLLPFFQDDRYEKKDNMPLFMLFKSDFEEKNDMFRYFDSRCRESGFDGICLIETYRGEASPELFNQRTPITKYIFYREPDLLINDYAGSHSQIHLRAVNKLKRNTCTGGIRVYSGQRLMKRMMEIHNDSDDVINGLWFEWDNTYRHKKNGYIITPYSRELFDAYMNRNQKHEYLFVNAWNEWCEGMTLEPTEEHGSQYLEWISEWKKQKEGTV